MPYRLVEPEPHGSSKRDGSVVRKYLAKHFIDRPGAPALVAMRAGDNKESGHLMERVGETNTEILLSNPWGAHADPRRVAVSLGARVVDPTQGLIAMSKASFDDLIVAAAVPDSGLG